jgi:exodeoxyribonuclease VII small subunit
MSAAGTVGGADEPGEAPDGQAGESHGFDPGLCGVEGPLESLTFERILSALESVTNRLASGELGIEAAADLYEQAQILHAAAARRLALVEARIGRLGRSEAREQP